MPDELVTPQRRSTDDGDGMTGGGTTPRPDPTILTDRAIVKAIEAERDYVDGQMAIRDERLNGIDDATRLRLTGIDQIPVQINQAVRHDRELSETQLAADRRFSAAEVAHLREVDDIRFQAAERLAARESELNALALAAAFAAQKEASAKEAEYTRIASIKSESATAQAIDKLGELFATQTRGLAEKFDDLRDRVGRIESTKVGATENRTSTYATIAVMASIAIALVAVIGFLLTKLP